MEDKELDKEFWKYVEIGTNMPQQSPDDMLIAYAYFKQATEGDNIHERPAESSNVVQTFKYDSWKRLNGMSQKEAKHKYIEIIRKLIEKENSLPKISKKAD